MSYPRVRIPDHHVEACRAWALEHIKPASRSEQSRAVSIHPDSSSDFEVQFQGKLREVAVCLYFGLQPSKTLNLLQGVGDHYDVPLGPIMIDVKGSAHCDAQLMPYSVGRTNAGYYEASQFTHLLMTRSTETDEYEELELCGWMTKQAFLERHLVAPNGHPRAARWIPGTWYVPIDWLEPVEQLRCYRGPYFDHAERFIHYCQHELCGKDAGRSIGTSLRQGKLGQWFCREHFPADIAPGKFTL